MKQNTTSSKLFKIEENPSVTIGDILIQLGKINSKQAEEIAEIKKDKNIRFGEAAIYLGLVKDADVKNAISRQFNFEYPLAREAGCNHELIAAYDTFGEKMKQLRVIRSQLLFRWFALGNRTLAISSVAPFEGASEIAANLGVAYAQAEKRTLLIDANFFNPVQHKIFRTENTRGLSDILIDRAGIEEAVEFRHLSGLNILFSGVIPPNPQELLSRMNFFNMCERTSNEFDVVIIDLSPLSTETGALEIAARVDGTIVIARKNKTSLDMLKNATQKLRSVDAKLVGFLLVDF